MKNVLGLLFLLCVVLGFSSFFLRSTQGRGIVFQKEGKEVELPGEYLIHFGDPEAPVKITEYFSFFCPYCLRLFREDFEYIKRVYIDTGKVHWTFHPVPMDRLTVQGMHCLSGLSDVQKRALLQVYLEEAEVNNPDFCVSLLQKAREIFGKPVPPLEDNDYLEKTSAFEHAFLYLKDVDVVEGVPSVEVNGRFFPEDIPDRTFVDRMIFKEGV